MSTIPKGLCQCGCGRATTIAVATERREGYVKGEPKRFLRGHCVRGAKHWLWNGGKSISNGYTLIRVPGHPRARKGSGYVLEHILVVERALGHALPPLAVVHHFDENKSNNTNGNLVVCPDESYHRLLHARQRAFAACGDPSAVPCRICGSYEDQAGMSRLRTKARVGWHRRCAAQQAANHAASARGRVA